MINRQLEKEMEMYFDETFVHNDEENRRIRNKLDELNNFEFDLVANMDELKVLATQNYGLISNRIRKKAWELLILNENNNFDLYEEISKRYLTFVYKLLTFQTSFQ